MASWATRLSHANGFSNCGSMLSQVRLPMPDLGRLDLGQSGHRAAGVLASLSGVARSMAGSLHLQALVDVTGSEDARTGQPWVIAARSAPSSARGARHAVCPECLATDSAPYWRQCWRSTLQIECPTHRLALQGACTHCGMAALLTSRRDAPLNVCEGCYQPYAGPPERRRYWQSHERWLLRGPVGLRAVDLPVRVAVPAAWWTGVRALLGVLGRPHRARRIAGADLPERHHACVSAIADGSMSKFLDATAGDRQAQLRFIAWLTDQWPVRFVQAMKQARITANDFNHLDVPVPYWVASVVDSHLARPRYQVSDVEVESARAVLASGQNAPSKIGLKRLLGVAEGAAVDQAMGRRASRLSLSDLHRVVQLVDRRVHEATAGRDARTSWVRDAACMAVAAWSGQHFPDVCSTAAGAGADFIRTWSSLASQQSANDPRLAEVFGAFSRWMHGYVHSVRPWFEKYGTASEALFLTRFGKPYRGFGLASRLADVLREANVDDWQRGIWLLAGTHLSHAEPTCPADRASNGSLTGWESHPVTSARPNAPR